MLLFFICSFIDRGFNSCYNAFWKDDDGNDAVSFVAESRSSWKPVQESTEELIPELAL